MKVNPAEFSPGATRFCVGLASSLAQGDWKTSKRLFRKFKKHPPLTHRALDELLIHAGLVLGYPVMIEAFQQARAVLDSNPSPKQHRSPRNAGQGGRRVFERIYGNQSDRLLTNLKKLHPSIPKTILHDVYGKVFARPGLSLQTRELVTVALLVVMKLETQLYSHLRGALRVGVPPARLRLALREMKLRYKVRTSVAERMLEELCSKTASSGKRSLLNEKARRPGFQS